MQKYIEELSTLYAEGFSLREISNLTTIPMTTIRSRLVTAGIEMRPPGAYLGNTNRWGTPHEVLIKTAFLYEKLGWSTIEIAEHMGVNSSTVRDRLLSHGVRIRSRSESIRLRFKRRGFNRDNTYLSNRIKSHGQR